MISMNYYCILLKAQYIYDIHIYDNCEAIVNRAKKTQHAVTAGHCVGDIQKLDSRKN